MKGLTKHLKTSDLKNIAQDLSNFFDNPKDLITEALNTKNVFELPTWQKVGAKMVASGFFHIYYYEQRDYLAKVLEQSKEYAESFSDGQVFDRYCGLVGRVINALMTSKIEL